MKKITKPIKINKKIKPAETTLTVQESQKPKPALINKLDDSPSKHKHKKKPIIKGKIEKTRKRAKNIKKNLKHIRARRRKVVKSVNVHSDSDDSDTSEVTKYRPKTFLGRQIFSAVVDYSKPRVHYKDLEEKHYKDDERKDAAHKAATHKYAAHKDAAHKDAAHKDAAHKDAAHKDSVHKDAAHKDTAHKHGAHKVTDRQKSKSQTKMQPVQKPPIKLRNSTKPKIDKKVITKRKPPLKVQGISVVAPANHNPAIVANGPSINKKLRPLYKHRSENSVENYYETSQYVRPHEENRYLEKKPAKTYWFQKLFSRSRRSIEESILNEKHQLKNAVQMESLPKQKQNVGADVSKPKRPSKSKTKDEPLTSTGKSTKAKGSKVLKKLKVVSKSPKKK